MEVQEDVASRGDEVLDPSPDHGQLLARAQAIDGAGAHACGEPGPREPRP